MTELLTPEEWELSQRLEDCEEIIQRGMGTFVEVGNALLDIRDGRLYRTEFATFEDYCRERWGFSRPRAYELINAADTVTRMSAMADIPIDNERQARALHQVVQMHGIETAANVLEEAAESGPITATNITEIARQLPPPEPPKKPEPVMLTLRTHTGKEVEYPKPQAKPTFNQTNDHISWAAWSWNPVTGCLHGCTYCYARDLATKPSFASAYPVGFEPLFHHERLDAPSNTILPDTEKDPRKGRVFVCSMADLFGNWVPQDWIDQVYASMAAAPQWRYLTLTKFPQRYKRSGVPPHLWAGTSVDSQRRVKIAEESMKAVPAAVRWLSIEPLLEPLQFTDLSWCDWMVIGSQTATRQPTGIVPEFAPPLEWVIDLLEQARSAGVAVYLKPNLMGRLGPDDPGMQLPMEMPIERSMLL